MYGGTPDFLNTYTYNNLGEVTDIRQTSQSGGNAVADKWVHFGYCDCGCCVMSIDDYASLKDSEPVELVAHSDLGYNYARQVTSLNYSDGQNNPLAGYAWTYDAAGRVVTAASNDGTLTYYYDADGQLTSVQSGQSTISRTPTTATARPTTPAISSGRATACSTTAPTITATTPTAIARPAG